MFLMALKSAPGIGRYDTLKGVGSRSSPPPDENGTVVLCVYGVSGWTALRSIT